MQKGRAPPVCWQQGHVRYYVKSGIHVQASKASTSAKEHKDDMDDLCVVCWEKARQVIFNNCKHMVRFCISQKARAAHVWQRCLLYA